MKILHSTISYCNVNIGKNYTDIIQNNQRGRNSIKITRKKSLRNAYIGSI